METNKNVKFKMYVAAVEQARIMSKGSGDLNMCDHVAKDLHEPGFDERMELLERVTIDYIWEKYRDEVFSTARKMYDN